MTGRKKFLRIYRRTVTAALIIMYMRYIPRYSICKQLYTESVCCRDCFFVFVCVVNPKPHAFDIPFQYLLFWDECVIMMICSHMCNDSHFQLIPGKTEACWREGGIVYFIWGPQEGVGGGVCFFFFLIFFLFSRSQRTLNPKRPKRKKREKKKNMCFWPKFNVDDDDSVVLGVVFFFFFHISARQLFVHTSLSP